MKCLYTVWHTVSLQYLLPPKQNTGMLKKCLQSCGVFIFKEEWPFPSRWLSVCIYVKAGLPAHCPYIPCLPVCF